MTKAPVDPDTVTVRVPFRIVKRGGRKEMQLPADMPIRRQTDDGHVARARPSGSVMSDNGPDPRCPP